MRSPFDGRASSSSIASTSGFVAASGQRRRRLSDSVRRGRLAGASSEGDGLQQRVAAEPVGAVDADAGALAAGEEAFDGRCAVGVRLHAAHGVVHAGPHGHGSGHEIGVGEIERELADLEEALVDHLRAQVAQVEEDAAVDAAALVDLRLLGAGDDVAGGQLHLVRRVAGHEALALGVQQVAAFAARSLGDEDAAFLERRRVELDELHVHQRHAGAIGEGVAVAGRDQGVGGRRVDATEAAGRQHDGLRRQRLDLAGAHVDRDGAPAAAIVDDERRHEPLVVGADVQLERLLVQDVQERLAGDVGDVAGAGEAGAAEGPLRDATVGACGRRRCPCAPAR